MTDTAQALLPGVTPAAMTIDVFFDEWVKAHPQEVAEPWQWILIKDAMNGDLPRRLWPNVDTLVDAWWTNRYNRLCASRGIRRQDISKTSDSGAELPETAADEPETETLAIGLRWRQAAFDEFFTWSVQCARRAVNDLEAIDVRIDVYAADHPEQHINVEDTKVAIRAAAGLTVVRSAA